jgi:hypothetical protein
MHRLLTSLDAPIEFISDASNNSQFDGWVMVSSLPRAFGTRLETIPASPSYLKADPALVARWAERIGTEGFKVGIAWQGTKAVRADHNRSIPLEAFAPLAAVPGVRLISLQVGPAVEQIAGLGGAFKVEQLGADFDSGADAFVDTAAVMANLDLVVTCDTSIAHLAGALGRPVWLALKKYAEWRWLCDRADSPWYPSMRLFRQNERGDWDELFGRIAAALRELHS